MSIQTYIATFDLYNYATVEQLQTTIFGAMTRWHCIKDPALCSWIPSGDPNAMSWTKTKTMELATRLLRFVIYRLKESPNSFRVAVYANDRIIRHGTRGDAHNYAMDCLRVQLLNPHTEIENEDDCCDYDDYFEDEDREFYDSGDDQEMIDAIEAENESASVDI
jgi:hypothetical protein